MQFEREINRSANSLVELSKSLDPYVVGAEGNVSSRLSDGSFLIKASGTSFSTADTNSFVRCDASGKKICESKMSPSIETSLHAWLYKNYECDYIAHTHPTNTLKVLCSTDAEKFSKIRLFPDHVVFNGIESCFVPYAMPGSDLLDSLESSISGFSSFPRLILLQNHGIVTVGKTSRECVVSTQICEKAAEIYLGARSIGIVSLTDDQKKQIEFDKKEIYRRQIK
jgi:ribulose-5-phosphate 4-epimerase/fuculose-1-phosphate aldolase